MLDLKLDCEMHILSEEDVITDFDCGNTDLNDFFNRDALDYKRQILARTCFFRHRDSRAIVCAFSVSANGIKTAYLPGSRRKKVFEQKRVNQ